MVGGRRMLALSLVVLGFCAPANGAGGSKPWARGTAQVTSFEAKASAIATKLAQRPVSIECNDVAAWLLLGARNGFEPSRTWAMTPLHWDWSMSRAVPDGHADFSPRACRFADEFWSSPTETGARTCQIGTMTQSSHQAGRPKRHVPVYGECEDWASRLVAVHVLGHESMHLYGFVGEATAECLAVQLDPYVATALGADWSFARSIGREFWRDYYAVGGNNYRSSDCRDGGLLDLFPDSHVWPTPVAPRPDLAVQLKRVAAALEAAGDSG